MKRTFTLLALLLPCLLFAQVNAVDGIFLNKAVPDGRVDSVYQGIDLPQAFKGEDVIIGVTDWGFDYTHPVFYDMDRQHYRILRAWDQFRNAGPAPDGFDYGTELVGQEALLAAHCDTFNVYEYGYHGTHVTSIAAGSGTGTALRGVAPEADIILCTFLVSEQAVIDAFHWMYQVAQQEQKRLVINMSWGLYYMGFMDGTGPIAEVMQDLSDQGVVFVTSAGNDGDVKFHLHQDFDAITDTLKSIVNFADSYGNEQYRYGQCITMTSSPNTSFSYAIAVTDEGGNIIGYTPFYDTENGDFNLDTLVYVVGYPIEYKIENVASTVPNARPHVNMRVKKSIYGGIQYALIVAADEGDFHAWNVIDLTNGVGNWGGAFTSAGTGWTAGDKEYGIGAPANVPCAISVAAHQARQKNNTTGEFTGSGAIANFSSYGPVIDNPDKPDISAPGVNVMAALSSYTSSTEHTPTNTISFNGRTYGFCQLSGTSMSSPFVAGVAALVLEANPYLTSDQVKYILKRTAYQDQYTEDGTPIRFGAGKVDAYQVVMRALNFTGVEQHSVSDSRCRVYPNPVSSSAYVVIESDANILDATLFDMSGRQLLHQQMTHGVNNLDMQNYAPGCYFLRVYDGKTIITKKIVKQ